MNNKTLGNSFEKELCNTLYANGFWAYNTVNKSAGQPADIIAARDGVAYLIDAKVCSDDIFDTKRIEENQKNAMLLFDKCGNHGSYFALKFSNDDVIMCSGIVLIMLKQDVRTLYKSDIYKLGIPLGKWMEVNIG